MVEHGLAAFPNEACGLLAGKEGRPVKFFPMSNQDASPVSYRLDPKEQLRVFDEIDDEGWELLGDLPHPHALGGLPVGDRSDRAGLLPGGARVPRDVPVGPSEPACCAGSGSRTGTVDGAGRAGRDELTPRFTEEQVRRYARHIILPGIGGDGQAKLLDAKVLCIGAGGLGSPVAMYLAAAGVGHARDLGLRPGRRVEPAAADHPLDGRRRAAEGRQRGRPPPGDQPDDRDRPLRHDPARRRTRSRCSSRGT